MLAYVFWHRRMSSVQRDSYEEKLIRYHTILDKSGLSGFKGSLISRISGAPWMPDDSEAYEEWYLIDGSRVLDDLNEVAVTGSRKEPHDDVAHLARDLRAGLYQLKIGEASSVSGNLITWVSKPSGTTYKRFYDEISSYLGDDKTSLWRRQMILGPTQEFCILSREDMKGVPSKFNPNPIKREFIWQSKLNG